MNKETIRIFKFTLFSASAGLIEAGSFALFYEIFAGGNEYWHWLCYFSALVLSVLWNFTFNRRYTFRSDGNIVHQMLLVGLFYCLFTPLSTWLDDYLAATLCWNAYLVVVIIMLLNFVTEFLWQRFVVYNKTIDNTLKH